MKRNEAIDNAFKAGFELVNGSIHVDGEDVTDEIVLLANIIEQATLERAAKVVEGYSSRYHINSRADQHEKRAMWESCAGAASAISETVRALKDSHE